jgi:hypothetical protein
MAYSYSCKIIKAALGESRDGHSPAPYKDVGVTVNACSVTKRETVQAMKSPAEIVRRGE